MPLLSQMLSHADPSQVAGLSRFFKTGPGQYGEGDKFLGIKVPVTREVVKACWRDVGFDELEECIRSEYHEVRLAALLTLVEIFRHGKRGAAATSTSCPAATGHLLRQRCVHFYLAHTAYINNWDLVDLSCYPLLGEWLLDKDRTLLYDLARSGKTIWEQRIGIVSTMTFIRHGQLDDTFAIADLLLHHSHDLIHKAVGWLLREAGKRNKSALEAYLQGFEGDEFAGRSGSVRCDGQKFQEERICEQAPEHETEQALENLLPRYQTMPRTMLRYAIEKFPDPDRLAYLRTSVR